MTYYDHATGLALGLEPWGQKRRDGQRPLPAKVRRKGGLAERVGALLRAKWRVRGYPGR